MTGNIYLHRLAPLSVPLETISAVKSITPKVQNIMVH